MSAHRLAGWIHTSRRDWSRAEESFRLAREFDPEDSDLAAAHAQALVGRAEEESPGVSRALYADQARTLIEGLEAEDVPAAMRAGLIKRLTAIGG